MPGYGIAVSPKEFNEIDTEGNKADFQRTGKPDYDYQYLKTLADNQRHETNRQDNRNYFEGPHGDLGAPPMIARQGMYDPDYGPRAPHNSSENTSRYFSGGGRVHPTPGTEGAPFEIPYQYHPATTQKVEDKVLNTFQNLVKHLMPSK